MKKIYFLAASLMMSAGVMAQTNLGFETWASGAPAGWDFNANILSLAGTVNTTPVTQGTTDPSEGLSYYRGETVTLTGSTNPQAPNGIYGGFAFSDEWTSTDLYEYVSFDVRHNVLTGDKAAVTVWGYDAGGDVQAIGFELLEGTQATWETVQVDVTYFSYDIASWDIAISSSADAILGAGANPGVAVQGSVLEVDNIVIGPILVPVPNATNIVATDIADNGNGLDLQVTFNAASDETNISSYWVAAFATGVNPGFAVNPLALVSGQGIEVAADGTNHSVTFTAASNYIGLNAAQTGFEANPIVENVGMTVYVYAVGDNGFLDNYAASNAITLTSTGSASITENELVINAYPNPADEVLNISMSETAVAVKVISMDGKVVASEEVNGTTAAINVAGLNSGVYFYEVTAANGNVVRNSFVKK